MLALPLYELSNSRLLGFKKSVLTFAKPDDPGFGQLLPWLPRSTVYYKSHSVTEQSQEEVDIKNTIDSTVSLHSLDAGDTKIRDYKKSPNKGQ